MKVTKANKCNKTFRGLFFPEKALTSLPLISFQKKKRKKGISAAMQKNLVSKRNFVTF